MRPFDQKALVETLFTVDEELGEIFPEAERIELVLIGASGYVLKGLLNKVTYDIDALQIDQRARSILEQFNISDRGGRILHICENYDTRLERVNLELKHINLFLMSDYDMIISKLGTGRSKDLCDIIESKLIFKIDFERLEKMLRDELASVVNFDKIWSDFNYLKMIRDEEVE